MITTTTRAFNDALDNFDAIRSGAYSLGYGSVRGGDQVRSAALLLKAAIEEIRLGVDEDHTRLRYADPEDRAAAKEIIHHLILSAEELSKAAQRCFLER